MDDLRDIEALLARFRPLIAGFFGKRLSSSDEAEDCAQDAVLALLGSLKSFAGRASLSTWVYRICQHVFYNHIRRKNSGSKLKDRLRSEPLSSRSPDDDLGLLRSVVERLPPAMRRLYDFYYIDRLGVREIGRELDCPEGSVKFLLYELRARIKQLIAGKTP